MEDVLLYRLNRFPDLDIIKYLILGNLKIKLI